MSESIAELLNAEVARIRARQATEPPKPVKLSIKERIILGAPSALMGLSILVLGALAGGAVASPSQEMKDQAEVGKKFMENW